MASELIDISNEMAAFRRASRELFNQYFHVENPYENGGWAFEERFSTVQAVLFEKMILEPCSIPLTEYGHLNTAIWVYSGEFTPIQINRGLDTGYWDFPLERVGKDVRFSFIRFFDWDQLAYRDNRYVRVKIEEWPGRPDVTGKQALLDAQYASFKIAVAASGK